MKKHILKFTQQTISLIISTIISALFCLNVNIFFANLGILKVQIELADEARISNSYNESIKWYSEISKRDNDYAPYAHLALAEIYSIELANKNYDKAFEEYKFAITKSSDIKILNSAMIFILQQITLKENDPSSIAIDFTKDDNINFIVDVMNKINETEPNTFSTLPITFPVAKEDIVNIFFKVKRFNVIEYKWEYTSTITSYQSNLAYTNDSEKVLLADWWEESTDDLSFSLVKIYKYYKYKKVEAGSYEISSTEAIRKVLKPQEQVFLKQLSFEKE